MAARMDLILQPEFVERVVFHAVRALPDDSRRYHRELARCYDEAGDRRDRAFRALHERWFDSLGFRRVLVEIVGEFPRIAATVGRFVVAAAPTPFAASIDLFGGPGDYVVAAAVAVPLLLDGPAFRYWARHELMHVADVLDPDFGYDPADRPGGTTPAAQHRSCDRYAVLWAISVDARIAVGGDLPPEVWARRLAELSRVFGQDEDERVTAAFNRAWEQFQKGRPTHRELLRMASAGLPGLAQGAGAEPVFGRGPLGSPCPLCRFATFDWASPEDVSLIAGAISTDFPRWSPADGVCGRCAEVYRTAGARARAARERSSPRAHGVDETKESSCPPSLTASAISSRRS